ncbi:Z1 domain-containing protein [uncultured Rikenella sp.]|uniref:Z1 domain-containing protein n=1 Tax=uncultured Rikenella sp. TaxID=368003 RepID=UPI0026218E05|nr:Z1 domain-containing protein [uncultured Rikenella sp.]
MDTELITVRDLEDVNPWNISVDGFFKQSAERQMLKDDISPESINDIFSNAVRILNQCPNPNEDKDIAKTGIVIGKVQSGKTSNFISVLALAFDNGYDISVVLGGNKLPLLKQNASRIKSAFDVDAEKLTVLKTNDNKSLINPARIREFIEDGRKVIIVGLKRFNHINQIADIFDDGYLADKPILIIDDEGDQATLNTKAYLDSMSSTYESVLELKSKLRRHCFLSITATPQANILIQAFDKLSPDFGELVYPGEGYCGLQEFHGENSDKHIYEIPLSECDLLDDIGVPESVYKAMAMFFVGNAIRYSRGDMGNHAMLIHPSRKKPDHRTVVKKLQGILDDWKVKAKTKLSGHADISYSSLKHQLLDAYNAFISDDVICVPFDELEPTILTLIKKCSPVLICNSDENASENSNIYKTNIFVGGDLVERGITIKGLAVTYITRRAKGKSNVDNTEQRARWFGYKASYLDVCRVFTTKDIKDDFTSILEHDEDMWASIERARDRGIAFKDMPRIFKLARNAFLRLTRANVAKTEQFALSEWKAQKFFIFDEDMVAKDSDIIRGYRERHKSMIIEEEHNPVQIHACLHDQHFNALYDELLSKIDYVPSEVLNKTYFAKLNAALQKLELDPVVDIVWVRDKEHETRKINQNNTISQLFQGRNPNTNTALYYEGDRSLVNRDPDHLQLQIHFVKPSNIESVSFYAPVLALYIPEWCSKGLSELVVNTND